MNFEKLNQRFSNIREEWQHDTQIDFQFKNKEYSEDLARLALEIPFQHNKYLNYYLPDPWNFRDKTWPKSLMGLYFLPNYYAKNYTKINIFKFIALSLKLILFLSFN